MAGQRFFRFKQFVVNVRESRAAQDLV